MDRSSIIFMAGLRWKTLAYYSEALLAEVVVDVGGLHGQVSGGVEGTALVLRRLICGLTHSKQVYKGQKVQL